MILVRWKGQWGLAMRVRPTSTGCAVRIPNCSAFANLGSGFVEGKFGAFWHRQFETTNDLKFYPRLCYLGYEVWPNHWHMESPEPILFCRIDAGPLSVGTDTTSEYMERVRKLQELGWKYEFREGCEKYVHVDELEKIEGPPPEGSF